MQAIIDLLQNREIFVEEIIAAKQLKSKIGMLLMSSILCFAIYGFIIGFSNSLLQAVSSAIKLPILYLLTMCICFPTLFIFNSIFGAKQPLGQTFALIVTGNCIIALILVAFAPVTLFFLLSSHNYPFYKLLNVIFFSISGYAGVIFFHKTFTRMSSTAESLMALPLTQSDGTSVKTISKPQPIGQTNNNQTKFLLFWLVLYCFVGIQLGWTLRPFFGEPNTPFEVVREIGGNFFADIVKSIGRM